MQDARLHCQSEVILNNMLQEYVYLLQIVEDDWVAAIWSAIFKQQATSPVTNLKGIVHTG